MKLSLFLTLLLAVGCCSSEDDRRRVAASGLPLDPSTVARHEDGSLRKAKLSQPAVVNGRLCKRWLHWHTGGALSGCQLAEDSAVQGVDLPAGTILWFDREEHLKTAWLSKDTKIQGHPARGGFGKVATSFYPSGRLRGLFLRDDAVIQGVSCAADLLSGQVRFHDNGRLASAELAEATVFADRSIPAGTRVWFDAKSAFLRADDG